MRAPLRVTTASALGIALGLCLLPSPRALSVGVERAAAKTNDPIAPNRAKVTPLTHQLGAERFPGQSAISINAAFAATQWKPSAEWLKTELPKYGRIVVFSDQHPSSGINPVTGLISPLEHWTAQHSADYVDALHFLQKEARAHGDILTIVENGDDYDFMLHTRTPVGKTFNGYDKYGPLNTPRNVALKLDAMEEGHPMLFAAKVDHLFQGALDSQGALTGRGNKIVIGPGNHDRQLLDPAVRAHLRQIFISGMTKKLETLELSAKLRADPAFRPELAEEDAREQAIGAAVEATIDAPGFTPKAENVRKARAIVLAQVSFDPFFVHGDFLAQHGNENDSENSFRTMLGTFYAAKHRAAVPEAEHATSDVHGAFARDVPLERAFGDYFVEALFNGIEAKVPWGASGNVSKKDVLYAALKAEGGGHLYAYPKYLWRLARAFAYVATRNGHGTRAEEAAIDAQEQEDLGQLVRDFHLVDKFNELRHDQPELAKLTEAEIVERLVEYRKLQAPPVLNGFAKGRSVLGHALAYPFKKRALAKDMSDDRVTEREQALNGLLFELGIKTRAIGHDHAFRMQPYLVEEPPARAQTDVDEPEHLRIRRSFLLDDAAWVNAVNGGLARDSATQPDNQRRGMITVRFDAEGSHAELLQWDRAAGKPGKITPIESATEAVDTVPLTTKQVQVFKPKAEPIKQ